MPRKTKNKKQKDLKVFERFNKVIISPHFTEKSSKQESLGKYTFLVSKDATKSEIKDIIQKVYGVKVIKVNISKNRKKIKLTQRGFPRIARKDIKKAIVTIEKGKTIDPLKI